MPRSLAPAAVACALTLLVTSCSLPEEEPEGPDHEATAISPDRLVHCEEEGDCDEAGAVRWSTPLEGEYQLAPYGTDYWTLVPGADAHHPVPPLAGAIAHEGTVYFHDHDRFTAVDAETGQIRWADEVVDPDQLKTVERVASVGGTFLLQSVLPPEGTTVLYTATPGKDGLQWQRVDADPGELSSFTPPVVNDHHALVADGRATAGDEQQRHHLIETATGDVLWSEALPGIPHLDGMSEDAVYTYDGEEGTHHRVDLTDGQDTGALGLPEALAGDEIRVGQEDAPVVYEGCGPFPGGEDPCTRAGAVHGIDPESGDQLWERSSPNRITSLPLLEGEDGGLVHARTGTRHALLEASTGRVHSTSGRLRPEARAELVETTMQVGEDRREQSEVHLTAPVKVDMPDAGGYVLDLAAGVHALGHVPSADGQVLSLFQGCAPDGVRAERNDAPAPGHPCVSPRIFAVHTAS